MNELCILTIKNLGSKFDGRKIFIDFESAKNYLIDFFTQNKIEDFSVEAELKEIESAISPTDFIYNDFIDIEIAEFYNEAYENHKYKD